MTTTRLIETPERSDQFVDRHIGSNEFEIGEMLRRVGYDTLETLVDAVVPETIRRREPLDLPPPLGEHEAIAELMRIAHRNQIFRSYIGLGYYDTLTPPPIQRNILENPGWYTQYTPYQAEISQGRLEALVNYQTMVADLTALPLANASLLDEATAAAEAMSMCWAIARRKKHRFFVAEDCHPQTLAVIETRAEPLGIEVVVGDPRSLDLTSDSAGLFAVLLQYPCSSGRVDNCEPICAAAREAGVLVILATDLLALTLLKPPGELGADVAVGSAQRFGVPLGFGGPHAGFIATRDEHKRQLPGRIIGVSKDSGGDVAYRLALQTREQHIRREKATSNICTAQVLLAIMAGMYAVYHGPRGLRRIASRIHRLTAALAAGLRRIGLSGVGDGGFFDTLKVELGDGQARDRVLAAAVKRRINLRVYDDGASLGVSLDETTGPSDVVDLWNVFAAATDTAVAFELDDALLATADEGYPAQLARQSDYLTHEVFNSYHSEHRLTRYIHRLQARDLSLVTSMIPLGSCTMKLNAASEMMPISWAGFGRIHPFAPAEQWRGYAELFEQLERWLCEITGFAALSLQPNAGAQGEYTGLLVIRAYHRHRGQQQRDVCLIPVSAHGTNPASAVMAGMTVVPVACDERGNIDVEDLSAKASKHRERLAALMVTYPSTHGVFEEEIRRVCEVVHEHGGQIYLDGANMNAEVGLCRPGDMGADVCHLNLHKTFAIPHGGGGPGMGPIGVAEHLVAYLPGHPLVKTGGDRPLGTVAAAPFGSPSILPIAWAYIRMMGAAGLQRASQVAILNANYMARQLADHYPVLFTGERGLVAHEFIIDMRQLKKTAGITVDDVAKRLMDFGFHAPTMAWPVPGTMMVEPTESEDKAELDRFCQAMVTIHDEIRAIERGEIDRKSNPLVHAPHTASVVAADDWDRPYTRQQAAFPAPWLRVHKFWPPVGRVDNAYGDRNLVCTCPPMDQY